MWHFPYFQKVIINLLSVEANMKRVFHEKGYTHIHKKKQEKNGNS